MGRKICAIAKKYRRQKLGRRSFNSPTDDQPEREDLPIRRTLGITRSDTYSVADFGSGFKSFN